MLRDRRAWPVAVFPAAYLVVFALANPLLFRWYLSPPLPFYFLLLGGGVWALATDVAGTLARRKGGAPRRPLAAYAALALFAALAVGCTLNGWQLHPDHGPDRPAPEFAGGGWSYRTPRARYTWSDSAVLRGSALHLVASK